MDYKELLDTKNKKLNNQDFFEFLEVIKPGIQSHTIISIDANNSVKSGSLDLSRSYASQFDYNDAPEANYYFLPAIALPQAKPNNGKYSKTDIAGSKVLYLDLDPPKHLDSEQRFHWQNTVINKLHASPLPFHYILKSGRGVWGFVLLDFVAIPEAFTKYQKALIRYANNILKVDADKAIHNPDRICRLPQSINLKTDELAELFITTPKSEPVAGETLAEFLNWVETNIAEEKDNKDQRKISIAPPILRDFCDGAKRPADLGDPIQGNEWDVVRNLLWIFKRAAVSYDDDNLMDCIIDWIGDNQYSDQIDTIIRDYNSQANPISYTWLKNYAEAINYTLLEAPPLTTAPRYNQRQAVTLLPPEFQSSPNKDAIRITKYLSEDVMLVIDKTGNRIPYIYNLGRWIPCYKGRSNEYYTALVRKARTLAINDFIAQHRHIWAERLSKNVPPDRLDEFCVSVSNGLEIDNISDHSISTGYRTFLITTNGCWDNVKTVRYNYLNRDSKIMLLDDGTLLDLNTDSPVLITDDALVREYHITHPWSISAYYYHYERNDWDMFAVENANILINNLGAPLFHKLAHRAFSFVGKPICQYYNGLSGAGKGLFFSKIFNLIMPGISETTSKASSVVGGNDKFSPLNLALAECRFLFIDESSLASNGIPTAYARLSDTSEVTIEFKGVDAINRLRTADIWLTGPEPANIENYDAQGMSTRYEWAYWPIRVRGEEIYHNTLPEAEPISEAKANELQRDPAVLSYLLHYIINAALTELDESDNHINEVKESVSGNNYSGAAADCHDWRFVLDVSATRDREARIKVDVILNHIEDALGEIPADCNDKAIREVLSAKGITYDRNRATYNCRLAEYVPPTESERGDGADLLELDEENAEILDDLFAS